VDARHDDLLEPAHLQDEASDVPLTAQLRAHAIAREAPLLEVEAGAEGAPVATEHHDADGGVASELIEEPMEVVDERHVEGVQGLGAVERAPDDRPFPANL
jgi:hypothetical protein